MVITSISMFYILNKKSYNYSLSKKKKINFDYTKKNKFEGQFKFYKIILKILLNLINLIIYKEYLYIKPILLKVSNLVGLGTKCNN